ncbi:MAG: hypothetical protein Kow0058_18940 [Roseovarius sp.]
MRLKTLFAPAILAGAAALAALPAMAEGVRYYSVPTSVNYCPAGLQPISIDGVICCGQPTTSVTWFEMKRHPVQRPRFVRADPCPEGVKGCN